MTIKYESSVASIDSAFLELGVGSTAEGGELYALKGLALPPADFLKDQKYVSPQLILAHISMERRIWDGL